MNREGVRSFHGAGKIQASTLPIDMRLQRMLGHIPALVHKKPESVLVVISGRASPAASSSCTPTSKPHRHLRHRADGPDHRDSDVWRGRRRRGRRHRPREPAHRGMGSRSRCSTTTAGTSSGPPGRSSTSSTSDLIDPWGQARAHRIRWNTTGCAAIAWNPGGIVCHLDAALREQPGHDQERDRHASSRSPSPARSCGATSAERDGPTTPSSSARSSRR